MIIRSSLVLVVLLIGTVLPGQVVAGEPQELSVIRAEELGTEQPGGTPTAVTGPAVPRSATLALPAFLLIPDSTADRVMSFGPSTGNLIDPDFIRSDPTNLATPIHAILGHKKDSILVSDQINDVVQEYAIGGGYVGIFAPAGGANTAILDNIRGIALRANGNLLVTVGGGTNQDTIAEFDTSGNYLGNFVAAAAGGLDSPFDILLSTEALVGAITSDQIHRYELATGTYIADLAPINSFPEQLALAGNGNLLVANFTGTQAGVVELATDGSVVGVYTSSQTGLRGVYELPNGNLLITNSNGVHEIDKSGNLIATKLSGVNARFIELIEGAVPVELQSFTLE